MPQNRVATSVLEARGAFLKHPERARARKNEPKPTSELGYPPEHMSTKQQEIWHELAATIPSGVAAKSDRVAMEIIVHLTEKLRKHQTRTGELSPLSSLLGKMGMIPADRSRVSASAPAIPSPWDEFD
jgi:hypothetical protein